MDEEKIVQRLERLLFHINGLTKDEAIYILAICILKLELQRLRNKNLKGDK